MSRQGQAIRTKEDITKEQMIVLPRKRWRMLENKPATGCKGF